MERDGFRQHGQSLNPNEREKVIAIHNLLLDHAGELSVPLEKQRIHNIKCSLGHIRERERGVTKGQLYYSLLKTQLEGT